MKNKVFLLTIALIFMLSLSACSDDDVDAVMIAPIEWGEMIQFSMSSGSFGEGSLSYSIIMREGEYLFSASGWNGLELDVERQPIPFEELDALRRFLEESGIEAWNGFEEHAEDVLDGFGFSISFEMENGSSFQAIGSNRSPAGFDAIYPALSFHLADIAFRYRTEQEWGNLVYMRYHISHGTHGDRYTFEIYVDHNDQVRINSRISGYRWRGANGLFDYSVMEDMREIVRNYGMDEWYGDVRFDPRNNRFISVEMRFDNDASFSIRGNLSPSGFDEANEAILAFFRNLAE